AEVKSSAARFEHSPSDVCRARLGAPGDIKIGLELRCQGHSLTSSMKTLPFLLGATLLTTCSLPGALTIAPQDHPSAVLVDPRIAEVLKQISAEHIQANIEKLVSFQTRQTLSAQDPASITAGRGIGAAREWIRSEFEHYSRDCGDCLEVKTDSFTEA